MSSSMLHLVDLRFFVDVIYMCDVAFVMQTFFIFHAPTTPGHTPNRVAVDMNRLIWLWLAVFRFFSFDFMYQCSDVKYRLQKFRWTKSVFLCLRPNIHSMISISIFRCERKRPNISYSHAFIVCQAQRIRIWYETRQCDKVVFPFQSTASTAKENQITMTLLCVTAMGCVFELNFMANTILRIS